MESTTRKEVQTMDFFSTLAEQAAWLPTVGAIVENFGSIGRVLEIDAERGVLLRGMPGQGFTRGHDKWYANPDKCRPVL